MTRKYLMDWVDSPNKMLSASATSQEFELRFGRLFARDQTILDSINVLLILI